MSTRIHFAWRVPRSRLNDLIDLLRPPVLRGFFNFVDGVMNGIRPEVIAPKMKEFEEAWKDHPGEFEKRKARVEAFARWEKARELFTTSRIFSLLDTESGINIWIEGKYAYVIPFASTMEFLKRAKYKPEKRLPSWVQDFSYWDNSDKPPHISDAEWAKRSRTWEKVCLTGGCFNKHRLAHEFTNLAPGQGTDTCLLVHKHIKVWEGRQLPRGTKTC